MIDTDSNCFKFKQFSIFQNKSAMKVNTDGVLLGAWVNVSNKKSILDIGSGTGVISIMLAQRNQTARITGVEIDFESFLEGKSNMQKSPWKENLENIHISIQDFSRTHGNKFDLIVSNPPFFTGGTFSQNQERIHVRHTTKLAHSELLLSVQKLLDPLGEFSVILPLIEGMRFIELAEQYGLYCNKKVRIKPKESKSVNRLLLNFSKNKSGVDVYELNIRQKNLSYSDEYKNLTKDFYLDLGK